MRIINKGLHYNRVKHNPLEKAFAVAWDKQQTGKTLAYILGDGLTSSQVSARDRLVAATVIQWLGSQVGQAFLRDVN